MDILHHAREVKSRFMTSLTGAEMSDNCGLWAPQLISATVVYTLLSVQCYTMHGQNINLPDMPVCVCVCVSVTLSVNSPTGQTPQRIFTVDSLKDADLCKDVILGVRSPPKPPFWRPE